MADTVDQTILQLLAHERAAILTGGFDKLPELGERKEVLFAELQLAKVSARSLQQIGAQVSRNQRLLNAALRGIREATERLGFVREVKSGLSTYDRQGQKSTVPAVRPAFEHKA